MGGCWRLGRGCRVAVRGGAPLKTPCGAAFRLQHRDSSRCPAVETSLDAADTSVRATGRLHHLWWASWPMVTPLKTPRGARTVACWVETRLDPPDAETSLGAAD